MDVIFEEHAARRAERMRHNLGVMPIAIRRQQTANQLARTLAATSQWARALELEERAEEIAYRKRDRAEVELTVEIGQLHRDIVGRALNERQTARLAGLADEWALGILTPQEAFDAILEI